MVLVASCGQQGGRKGRGAVREEHESRPTVANWGSNSLFQAFQPYPLAQHQLVVFVWVRVLQDFQGDFKSPVRFSTKALDRLPELRHRIHATRPRGCLRPRFGVWKKATQHGGQNGKERAEQWHCVGARAEAGVGEGLRFIPAEEAFIGQQARANQKVPK